MPFNTDPINQQIKTNVKGLNKRDILIVDVSSYSNATASFTTIADFNANSEKSHIIMPLVTLGYWNPDNSNNGNIRITIYDRDSNQEIQKQVAVPASATDHYVWLDAFGILQASTTKPASTDIYQNLMARRILIEGSSDSATLSGVASMIIGERVFS